MLPSSIDSRAKALMMAARRFSRMQMPRTGVLSAMDMKPSEIFLMVNLKMANATDGLKPSELAERLQVSPGNVTQLITTLESRGLVERLHDDKDRRTVRVKITEKGEAAMAEAHAAMADSFRKLIDYMGEGDCDRFIALLEKASDYLISQNGNDPIFCARHADSHAQTHDDPKEGSRTC